jgi:hypothetical protein
MNEKHTAKPVGVESTPQYKRHMSYDHRRSEAWFPSDGLQTVTGTARSVCVKFPYRYRRRQSSGTLLSFTTSHWGCLAIFPTKRPSTFVAICGPADRFIYGSCIIVLRHISFSQFGNSEQLVSGTSDRTRLNNSVACFFARLKFLTFVSLGTSEVYRLCHRSH